MTFLTYRRFWIIGLIPFLVAAAPPSIATPPGAPGLLRLSRFFVGAHPEAPTPSRAPNGLHVLLGRVLSARVEPAGWRGTRYTYVVQVLCTVPGGPKLGRSVTIVGLRTPPRTRSWPLHIAIMRPGTYFVADPVQERGGAALLWTGDGSAAYPFGVFLPSPVAEADVSNLRAAILAYAKLRQAKSTLTDAECAKLRRGKNYFLWALGTWVLAKRATQEEARLWAYELSERSMPGISNPPMLSPRRELWILHCLRRVVPANARPSTKELFLAVAGYLRRLAAPHEPGYKP